MNVAKESEHDETLNIIILINFRSLKISKDFCNTFIESKYFNVIEVAVARGRALFAR